MHVGEARGRVDLLRGVGGGADQRPLAEYLPGRYGVDRVETQVHAVGAAAEGEVDTTVDQQARMAPRRAAPPGGPAPRAPGPAGAFAPPPPASPAVGLG